MAVKYFVYSEKEKFSEEVEKCLSMHPHSSTVRYGTLGQYLALYGEWDKGMKILEKVMGMNVSFPLYFYGTSSLYHYRNNEYEKALVEANLYNMPTIFWAPMQRAACLGQLGKISEAKQHIEHLLLLKPGFMENARELLSRFIKQEDLIDHVIEGLEKAGIKFS